MNIVALIAAVYGAYVLYAGNAVGLSPMEAIKGLGLVTVGLGYLAINFLPILIAKLKTFKLPVLQQKKEPDMPTNVSPDKMKVDGVNIFAPEAYEFKDLECLVHLRNRCAKAGSVEGIEACEKLNSVIFKLNNPTGDKA